MPAVGFARGQFTFQSTPTLCSVGDAVSNRMGSDWTKFQSTPTLCSVGDDAPPSGNSGTAKFQSTPTLCSVGDVSLSAAADTLLRVSIHAYTVQCRRYAGGGGW